MALDATQQADCARQLIRQEFITFARTANLTTDDVANLVADVDAWCEANQASFNNGIRAGLRTAATTTMKATALAYVAMKRGGVI